jgi:hypothetical protein
MSGSQPSGDPLSLSLSLSLSTSFKKGITIQEILRYSK